MAADVDVEQKKSAEAPEAKAPEAPPGAMPPAPFPMSAGGEVDASEKKPKKKRKSAEAAVRLKKVTKRFKDKTAVDGVSLKIDMGVVYGLIGPNGAGKTTTFSMLAGYLKPTEGNIEVLGFPPDHVDELRSRLGVLPQDAMLPPADKVGEFLLHMARLQDIPADKAEAEAREVLREVDGLDWWSQRCGSLSHGMAKRVALAQALLGEPDVVLLDEPTAGLDPRVAYEVRQIIKNRRGRCTVIISSHNLQELEEICDGAAILDRGRVVASGTMTELTASSREVRIRMPATPPAAALRAIEELPIVSRTEWNEDASGHRGGQEVELVVYFEPKKVDAETVIGHVLWILLNNQARISGVSKGRGLEQRVMDLT